MSLYTRNKRLQKRSTTSEHRNEEANGNPESAVKPSGEVDLLEGLSAEQINTCMRELYSGLLGGRKFHYQLKLAINRGIDILEDPMLGCVVHALQLANYQSIKKKARIFMPQSTTLIGVVDETGLLEENEVFV